MCRQMETQSTADRVYAEVRDMAARFAFKPDERINEVELARALSASRTPLREALNRLAAEGFLRFSARQGFFCRSLDPAGILELYEARQAVESETARLAAERADAAELAALRAFLTETGPRYADGTAAVELVGLDEAFHMRVAAMSGNAELARMLSNLNARSRFVRLIDMETRREITPGDHMQILDALEARAPDRAGAAMRDHIHRRRHEATDAARLAFSRLYVDAGA